MPRDPALAAVVTDVAAHAVTYAGMDGAAGTEFIRSVVAASAAELSTGETGSCLIVVISADGELRLTIGGHTVAHTIAA